MIHKASKLVLFRFRKWQYVFPFLYLPDNPTKVVYLLRGNNKIAVENEEEILLEGWPVCSLDEFLSIREVDSHSFVIDQISKSETGLPRSQDKGLDGPFCMLFNSRRMKYNILCVWPVEEESSIDFVILLTQNGFQDVIEKGWRTIPIQAITT